jgi:hypothetical protein
MSYGGSGQISGEEVFCKSINAGNVLVGASYTPTFYSATGTLVIPYSALTGASYTGSMFYNTADSKLHMYNGSAWVRTSAFS